MNIEGPATGDDLHGGAVGLYDRGEGGYEAGRDRHNMEILPGRQVGKHREAGAAGLQDHVVAVANPGSSLLADGKLRLGEMLVLLRGTRRCSDR